MVLIHLPNFIVTYAKRVGSRSTLLPDTLPGYLILSRETVLLVFNNISANNPQISKIKGIATIPTVYRRYETQFSFLCLKYNRRWARVLSFRIKYAQCCVTGSGIRCLFDPWIREPGSGMGKKSGSGSGIRDEQPESYFLLSYSLENNFFDADPGWKKLYPG